MILMINRLQPVALNNDNPPQDTVLQKSNASIACILTSAVVYPHPTFVGIVQTC